MGSGKSEVGNGKSEVGSRKWELWGVGSGRFEGLAIQFWVWTVRNQKPSVRTLSSLKSEVWSWKSEVGSRKSEVGSWKSEVWSWKSEVRSRKTLLGFRTLVSGWHHRLLHWDPVDNTVTSWNRALSELNSWCLENSLTPHSAECEATLATDQKIAHRAAIFCDYWRGSDRMGETHSSFGLYYRW